MGLIVHSDPKRCDVMEQHIYCEFFRGKERDFFWKKTSSLRMVLHQLLQLQFLPLLVVFAGEPPVEEQPTHAHTV